MNAVGLGDLHVFEAGSGKRFLELATGQRPGDASGSLGHVGAGRLGGVFIVGSIAWGMAFDSFRPDRYDLAGAAICLVGVG